MVDEIALCGSARDALLRAARAAAPRECTAVLGGDRASVTDVVTVPNVAAAADRFEVAPADFLAAERELARRGRAFVGFAHSHPGGACAPSTRDRETLWPDCVQLITDGADVRAFRLGRDGAVHPLKLLAAEARR